MKIDICLAEVMETYGIRLHGSQGPLAQFLGSDRGAVRRLMKNEAQQISLERLGAVCEWLVDQVAENKRSELLRLLPGILLKRAGLWEALLRASKITTVITEKILVTEDKSDIRRAPFRKWLSSNDVRAAREIEHQLSSDQADGFIDSYFVPFYFPEDPGKHTISDAKQEEAIEEAKRRHVELLDEEGAVLILGSQRVNLVTEISVAASFGVRPFEEDPKRRVPFYIRYRDEDPTVVASCFGGHAQGRAPGVHYRPYRSQKWIHLECGDGKHAAGVVTVRCRGGHTEVVLFGFSGNCTRALGELFRKRPGRFWPGHNVEFGAFVCHIPLADATEAERERGPVIVRVSRKG